MDSTSPPNVLLAEPVALGVLPSGPNEIYSRWIPWGRVFDFDSAGFKVVVARAAVGRAVVVLRAEEAAGFAVDVGREVVVAVALDEGVFGAGAVGGFSEEGEEVVPVERGDEVEEAVA